MLKKIAGLGVPLFFILPVVGFLTSLFNIRSRSGAIVYIGFAMFFGYSISFSDTSADSYRYAEAFTRFDNYLSLNDIIVMYLGGELRDVYRIMLFYITSIFTNDPKVMYAIAGLVYGILSYLCLLIFVKERGSTWDKYSFILALVFYTFISLSSINSFRFNTGALVFFYANYNYFIQKKRIWFIGIIITPLFHYGFIPILPVFLLYKFIHPLLHNGKEVKPILLYLFVLTFFASWFLKTNFINLRFLSNTDLLSGAVGYRLNYINSNEITDLVDTRNSNSFFLSVQQYFNDIIKIYVFISILFLNNLLKRMKVDNKIEYINLFSFVLFFFSFSNVAMSFPSGGRFMYLAFLFFVLCLVKFYRFNKIKQLKKIIIWALPVFSFNIAFINFMLPYLILSPTFWFGNIFW